MEEFTYKKAGVDIRKGETAVNKIKSLVRSTFIPGVIKDLGGFGGMFQLDLKEFKEPVLVASTDGVGTKLKVAVLAGKHHTVGQDLVNHCVNDIAVGGAKPLFFLDYFASGKLDADIFYEVISGFTEACRENSCALIGGETAEMPDMYGTGDYDLCGTIVGIVDRKDIIDGSQISRKSAVIGVNSNGLHTNGFSLARKVLLEEFKIDSHVSELKSTLAEELLRVHVSYLHLIRYLTDTCEVHGFAHITGGGIAGNSKRILPEGLKLKIDWKSWPEPAVFSLIRKMGNVPEADMRHTFNLGIGLTVFTSQEKADSVLREIRKKNFQAYIIGQVY